VSKDQIYRQSATNLVDFAFDQRVVDVFPDMIRRSVPAYETVVPLSALMAARHAHPGTQVYDLGCSRGATTAALLEYCDSGCNIIGVDSSQPMIDSARTTLSSQRLEWRCEDILTTMLTDASAVVMNYTLQFIEPEQRGTMLRRIHAALRPGGPLIYAEKIVLEPEAEQQYFNAVHLDFKRANGYSELEVAQKRSALERVMQPDTERQHLDRLADLGYREPVTWFRCLNWAAFIAFK
jgi:tRNA (cmo5U34)-methyltransferase